jgi:membrane protein implicated in regulation of membrane protease activity
MPWWAWIIVGAILLGSELAFIDAQFYLVFFGVAALVVGALGLGGIAIPEWSQWLVFAVLSIASLMFFRRKMYDLLRSHTETMQSGPAGEMVTVPNELAAGASCRLEYRGSTWTAKNIGTHSIDADASARIVSVDGLTLHIRSAKHS